MPLPLGAIDDALQALAPLALAEPWDNVGLLCGEPTQRIVRVAMCVDWTWACCHETQAMGPLHETLVVAYHPPWFHPLKRLLPGTPLSCAIRAGAALYSPHTALDAACHGTNEALAAAAGVLAPIALQPFDAPTAAGSPAIVGQGRHGPLPAPLPWSTWLAGLKTRLGGAPVWAAVGEQALAQAPVRHVAVAAGAGRALCAAAQKAGADVLVTGELGHHEALAATAAGLRVVALRHSVSERLALPSLAERLQRAVGQLPVRILHSDADPFAFA